MSLKLGKEITFQLQEMEQTIELFTAVFARARENPAGNMETLALAELLHAFYSGVENVFKRIALNLNGGLPRGDAWHRDLLDSMLHESINRPAVISPKLHDRLQRYMVFRHLIRNIYPIHLRWDKMEPLINELELTFSMLKDELGAFLKVL